MPFPAPQTVEELLYRAQYLRGQSIAQLYHLLQKEWPRPQQDKGFKGQLIEYILGAPGSTIPQPDFLHLGIELKTIPLRADGRARESTYITRLPMPYRPLSWKESPVYAKLQCVLWIPILPQDIIGAPLLWKPSAEQEEMLKTDFEELSALLSLGESEQLSAHLGQALQLRPKAAHSRTKRPFPQAQGHVYWMVPQGFYLRPSFTSPILQKHLFSHDG